MAIENSRFKTRREREEEEKKQKAGGFMLPSYEELTAIEEKAKEDAARAASSEKKIEFFKKPSIFDDGYQFGDVTKSVLGTVGDVGVGAVKGVMKMGEGIGDAAQYGVAAVADAFGGDEWAEKVRRNAQRTAIDDAFAPVDKKLDKYSVLGKTGDAAAESLGQIGGILATGGIASALGAGTLGATAATAGLMGLSSFGSGTGEAYAAGAEEGEAEAYGAIAGAADALSEMIFGGLGKGFKALGLSKGITSADDALAKAVTSKIRNTLAKNTVQLGIKAGAEGVEEVLAGTMQAAGKKMTYMSERDFADIIRDENLLEQFVVGAFASGIAQAPSFVSANRAGVDLVSDGTDAASDSAQDEQDKFSELRGKNADFGEIERTGLASGANEDDIRMAGDLSSALGKRIRFYREEAQGGMIRNGEYHEDEDTIYINAASKNVKAQIVAHELTHSIERAGAYQSLVNLTMEKLEAEQKAKGKTIDDLYRAKEMQYAKGGVKLASYEEITSELVAEFVEKRLLTDADSIKSLVQENRTLGQRIREWFDSLLAKMDERRAAKGDTAAQARVANREFIVKMRDLYAQALGEGKTAESGRAGGVKHSIVGANSMVNRSQLPVAMQMEADGKTADEIYAETGWYKQSDGKWRTELLDEIAEPGNFDREGLYMKMGNGSKYYEGKIWMFLNAPQLYDAYPRLKNVTLKFQKIDGEAIGGAIPERDVIIIDPDVLDNLDLSDHVGEEVTMESVLAHEIQHMIQSYERFAEGTNPEDAGDDDAYFDTPGEIEARDVMSRLRMTADERRKKMPVRFSVSEADDARYMDAVQSGDTETARKMVDKAAKAAGFATKLKHGTSKSFTSFSASGSKTGAKSAKLGVWLSDSQRTAKAYSTPQESDYDNEATWNDIRNEADKKMAEIKREVFHKSKNVEDGGFLVSNGYWNLPALGEAFKKYCPEEYKELIEIGVFKDEENYVDLSKETYFANKENQDVFRDVVRRQGELYEWYSKIIGIRIHPAQLSNKIMQMVDDGVIRSLAEGDVSSRIMDVYVDTSDFAVAQPPYNRDEDKVAKIKSAARRGKNGVVFKNILDGGERSNHYVVFNGNKIKSADAVTYDDNGNVIPLSERFKVENPDIRYSVSEEEQPIDPLAGVSSAVDTEVEENDAPMLSDADVPVERGRGEQTGDGYIVDVPEDGNDKDEGANGAKEKKQGKSKKTEEKRMTRERAMSNVNLRQAVRDERKTVDRAQTAFRRLGYHIAGAVSENYEDAAGIIEDTRLAAQADYDIREYIEDNDVRPHVDSIAKLIATGEVKPTRYATGLTGEQLKMATELAQMYKQYDELAQNAIKAQGKAETRRINEEYDRILGDYNWFSDKGKKAKRLGDQLQLNLSNPEQVMRDAFGDAYTITDSEGNQKTVDVAEALNDYIIRPTIENSAEARRQTNRQVARLREFGLNESESALTQLYAEYSAMKEAGSKKVLLDKRVLRELLLGTRDAREVAHKIALKEGEIERSGKEGENGFTQSIIDVFENALKVNGKRAAERALREHKAAGGTNGSWNALPKTEKQAKLEAAAEAIVDESIERIEGATKEMRVLLDDMYEAINAISVIHGAQPIPFRRGYMPHSHRQKTEVQQWFSDHMGGIDVTPVGDLPTDIAGKTADRKPNKRWMAHAQQRTGPRTTWDALGNIEEYLRIANDTIYHMDDIKKMRVLERYIRGIYSVARGETGETMKKKVKNDVLQRMYGSADDETLVFLGLKKNEKPVVNDEDMDLSQMTPVVTWLTNYANDLAAKQIFNRDIESVAGRKYNNLANTFTSWSSRVMMQYNISSNLKQLSQLGTVSGDVGARITKDAAAMTARSMRNLGNGTNELEQKYHISERSTFLAEKAKIEEATFASDHDLTDKQKKRRDDAAEIWDYAWSFTDTTMSRFAVYSYFMEGMERGMDDTAALQYADAKARNILASRMKGSSPLIFQSKNPILRLFTMFQREPLAAWQDVLKTMPREYAEMQKIKGEAEVKTWLAKRITGRVLGASMVNMFYATVLGLGTPAMFDLLGAPLSALLEKVIGDLTEDEDDDQTWGETLKGLAGNLRNEIADDLPFASLINMIVNTAIGTEFESRLPLNMPDYKKFEEVFKSPARVRELTKKIEEADDAETIEALTADRDNAEKQVPFTVLAAILEIVGVAAPAGNQIRKSVSGLVSALRGGEYASDGRLKYEISGADAVRAVVLGKSNTKAAQEWIDSDFDSYTKTETAAYEALTDAGVSAKDAADYVKRVTDTEYDKDVETKASAQARKIDRMKELDDAQRAELYYTMVATDAQRNAVDDAVSAGADKADAVDTARDIRDASKRLDKLTALSASDMDTAAREAMYLSMIATKEKDEDGNIIGTDDDARLEALYTVGLDFDDFLDAKIKQSALNANEGLTANQRAARFLSWVSGEGYNSRQEEAIAEQFSFASGFKAEPATYKKMVTGGVTTDNAIKLSDALSGADRSIDKINAMWGTGIIGEQLDLAIKAVVSDSQYEKYRIIIDANVPLEVYTWVLDNADTNGNGSINAEERTQILSRLALSRKELSALWLATGGSEKSNPWGSGGTSSGKVSVKTPTVKVPEIKMPEIDFNVPHFDFEFGGN